MQEDTTDTKSLLTVSNRTTGKKVKQKSSRSGRHKSHRGVLALNHKLKQLTRPQRHETQAEEATVRSNLQPHTARQESQSPKSKERQAMVTLPHMAKCKSGWSVPLLHSTGENMSEVQESVTAHLLALALFAPVAQTTICIRSISQTT